MPRKGKQYKGTRKRVKGARQGPMDKSIREHRKKLRGFGAIQRKR